MGLFQSIRSTIKYQPGEANVFAATLSRSQCKLEKGSMDDSSIVAAVAIEAQISELSGVSVELTAEDLQR